MKNACLRTTWSRPSRAEETVSGVGVASWPDIPPQRAEAQGRLLVPASGVDEGEGRDREQVGEEAIGRKRPTGTPNSDMTQR